MAQSLFDMHGLTLSAHKTRLLASAEFVDVFLDSESRKEVSSLQERFRELLGNAGVDDPYGIYDYTDLPESVQREIDSLNLAGILEEQLDLPDPDFRLVRFLIQRLSQTERKKPVEWLLRSADKIYPLFSDVISYLIQVDDRISDTERSGVATFILGRIDNSLVGHLDFHKMLLLEPFVASSKWRADGLPALANAQRGELE